MYVIIFILLIACPDQNRENSKISQLERSFGPRGSNQLFSVDCSLLITQNDFHLYELLI